MHKMTKFFESYQTEQWKRFGKKSAEDFQKKLEVYKKKNEDFGGFLEGPKNSNALQQNTETKNKTPDTKAKDPISKPVGNLPEKK